MELKPTMALAKTNPLPNGLYWIDLASPSSARFEAWMKANGGRVFLRRAAELPSEPKRVRVLFEVKGPPGAFPFGLGYPTITDESSTSGDFSDPLEWLSDAESLESLTNLEGLGGRLLLMYALWRLSKAR